MNSKKLIIYLVLLFSLLQFTLAVNGACPVAHCMFPTGTISSTEIGGGLDYNILKGYEISGAASPTVDFNGCAISTPIRIDGVDYSFFGIPGTKVVARGFGFYNFTCDNGWSASHRSFTGFFSSTNSTIPFLTNSTNADKTPIGTARKWCAIRADGCFIQDTNMGAGNLESIEYSLTTRGDHNVVLKTADKPVANVMPSVWNENSSNNIYVGFPSLIVSGKGDSKTVFFEKEGEFNKNVVFTLLNKSPLDLNLTNYEIKCLGENIVCSIDKNYIGYTINKFNGKMIVTGNIKVNKAHLPLTVSVKLDVNYSVPVLSTAACSPYKNNLASSKPITHTFGLLDKQQFQIGIKSDFDYTGCVGEDGMIGMTGENFAPRINLGFGGKDNDDEGVDETGALISIDECDAKKIDGSLNSDWVYCTQKETLVELAKKIGKLWEIDVNKFNDPSLNKTTLDERKNLYASTQMYLRSQSLTRQSITGTNGSIDLLSENFGEILTTIGLPTNNPSAFNVSNPSVLSTQMKNLYNNIEFSFNGGQGSGAITAGLYAVNIDVEIDSSATETNLFLQDNSLNPDAKIKIDFTKISEPSFNWFFYDYGNLEIDLTNTGTQSANLWEINSGKRGILLTIEHNPANPNFNNNMFYPNYATTLVARLKSNSSGNADANFSITSLGNYDHNNFSYWTGFASSLDEGCGNIDNEGDSTLPYREPDSRVTYTSTTTFEFSNYKTSKPNSTMYLQSVLFWPTSFINNSTGLVVSPLISAPFGLMVNGTWYNGSASSPVNNIRLNTPSDEFMVENLRDLINAIEQEKVCINTSITPTRTTKWTLFWNQTKILETINSAKRNLLTTNNDANLCATREILGG